MKNNTLIIIGAAVILVAAGLLYVGSTPAKGSTQLDGFAQCLSDKGVKFFGAFWCPHCQSQKKLFGGSVSKVPYVECSTPDSQGQTPICIANKIQSYPTWVFADGSTSTGEQTLSALAEKSGCSLPNTGAQVTVNSETPSVSGIEVTSVPTQSEEKTVTKPE